MRGPVCAADFMGLEDEPPAAGRAVGNLAAARAAPDLACGGNLEDGSELAGGPDLGAEGGFEGGGNLEAGGCLLDGAGCLEGAKGLGDGASGAGVCCWAGGVADVGVKLAFTFPGNCSSSLPLMAARIKVIQMGSAARAPVSLSPSD